MNKLKSTFLFLVFFCASMFLFAQDIEIPADTTVLTNHSVTIKGQKVSYSATTGTQPVWDENGKAIATLFYTYYKRSGSGDAAKRPLVISFNGGPGSASVCMHVAYTGPKVLNSDEEGYPQQPYGVHDNQH